MKYFFFVSLIFSYASLSAQARLGSSISEIREEFKETKYHLKSNYDNKNDFNITVELTDSYVTYYFHKSTTCTATVIQPKNEGILNGLVELYNKKYVILSSRNWRMYSKYGISNIELFYTTDGSYYIIWTIDN